VKPTLQAFLPLGLWAAAVLVVGAVDFGAFPGTLPRRSDKLAHFILYGVGGALAAWAGRVRGGRAGLVGVLVVLLTGVVDELRQATVPHRDADIMDWVADGAGALVAYFLARRLLSNGMDDV
jgi:VanZ family protein